MGLSGGKIDKMIAFEEVLVLSSFMNKASQVCCVVNLLFSPILSSSAFYLGITFLSSMYMFIDRLIVMTLIFLIACAMNLASVLNCQTFNNQSKISSFFKPIPFCG